MTYLSQAQPWLQDYETDLNLATARQIRKQIKEIIDDHTLSAAQSGPPYWLCVLIRLWHDQRANVLTLNYDTLVERVIRRMSDSNVEPILAQHIYPPYFADIASRSGAAVWDGEASDTFLYLKLHGSVNWYYSGRDDFYGETIFCANLHPIGEDYSRLREEKEALELLSKDKDTLIIPPVTEKTTYFNNETVRGLWKDARSALAEARRIVVIGYSLPPSDLGMRLFLANNQPAPKTPVYVVDTNPCVAERYADLLPKLRIVKVEDFLQGPNPVERFSQQYPNLVVT